MDTPNKDTLTQIFQEQSAAHKEARKAFLENAIQTADTWIGYLQNPEIGAIGQQFLAQAATSGCKQEIDIFFNNGSAEYSSFSYKKGFVNQVTYGPGAEESLPQLFSAKVHETTHALQKMRSPALHASPFNRDTRIVICPRDWVTLEERCEQDAYTKQALFNTMLASYLPDVKKRTRGDAVSVEEFEKIRAAAPNMGEALVECARQALNKSFYSDNPNAEKRFKNVCQDQALKNYEAGMDLRRNNGETDIVFVRLEPEDIEAIGASCGPNIFGAGAQGVLPEFLEKPIMLPNTQEKLAEVNKSCGITDTDALPTLTDALQKIGMTRQEFLERAYKQQASQSSAPAVQPAPLP